MIRRCISKIAELPSTFSAHQNIIYLQISMRNWRGLAVHSVDGIANVPKDQHELLFFEITSPSLLQHVRQHLFAVIHDEEIFFGPAHVIDYLRMQCDHVRVSTQHLHHHHFVFHKIYTLYIVADNMLQRILSPSCCIPRQVHTREPSLCNCTSNMQLQCSDIYCLVFQPGLLFGDELLELLQSSCSTSFPQAWWQELFIFSQNQPIS
ncbi:hypothetical protein Mapa_015671 [Marchantia paleacea]|nr:hypothetical protein Mapa_015671 [Marchantia paleacea]